MRQPLDPKTYDEPIFDALITARERFGDKDILEDQDRHPLTYTGLIRAAFVLGRKIAGMTEAEARPIVTRIAAELAAGAEPGPRPGA